MILDRSKKAEPPSIRQKKPRKHYTNSTNAQSHGKKLNGRRRIRGIGNGRIIKRLQKRSKLVQNCSKLSTVRLFGNSLAGPVFYPCTSGQHFPQLSTINTHMSISHTRSAFPPTPRAIGYRVRKTTQFAVNFLPVIFWYLVVTRGAGWLFSTESFCVLELHRRQIKSDGFLPCSSLTWLFFPNKAYLGF